MPDTTPPREPSDIAKRFSDYHNAGLEIPDFLRVDAAEQKRRNASSKGKRLRWTRDMKFDADKKLEDPATKKLRREIEAAAQAETAARFEQLRSLRTETSKAAMPATTTETETMAKAAKKTTTAKKGKAQPKTGAKRQAKAASKKAAVQKARTPVAAGERARYDWKAAEEKALLGTIPPRPDFSAPTHARFLPIMEEIAKACAAKDLKALKAVEINPISSTPKAMDRYRALCVKALTGAK